MKSKLVVLVALILLVMPAMTVMARGSQASGETVVAGVVFQEDQFMRMLTIGYEDAAKEAGVRIMLGNTGGDMAKETELVNTYVAQKVAGLVIAPLSPSASLPTLQRASSSMLIATVDSPITSAPFIVGGFTSDPYNLGYSTGEAAAIYIRDKMGGRAKIALVQYMSLAAEVSSKRSGGFVDAVKKVNPNVEIVADQDAWMQDTAIQVAGDILTANRDINLIFAANDGGTIGSVMAVRNAGLAGKVVVFGIDTGDQQISMLRSGDNILQAVTGQDPYTQGYTAMKLVIDSIRGKDYSSTKGKISIIPGALLNRNDPAGIDAFEKTLRERLSR